MTRTFTWGWPRKSRRAHLFESLGDGYSLCHFWFYKSDTVPETGSPGADECTVCVQKLADIRKKEKA